MKEKKIDGYEKWEIESWADALMRAEEIKKDKKKMKLLAPFLKKKVDAVQEISSLAELREVAQEKAMEESENGDD